MRIGLRARFIVLITAVLLVVFMGVAYFLIRNADITEVNDLNRESKAFASLASSPIGDTYTLYKDSGTLRINQQMQQYTSLDTNVSNVGIVGIDGSVLFQQNARPSFSVTSTDVASFETVDKMSKDQLITQIVQPYFDSNDSHPFSVVFDISNTQLVNAIQVQEIDIVVFALIGLVVTAITTYYLVRRFFLLPIEKVSRVALVISHGQYDQKITAERNDEIGDLAGSVSQMADTLKGDIQKLQEVDQLKNEFITITSHNLRTPLTIINGNIELIKSREQSEDMLTMVKAIESSTRNLGVFAEDMLTIASIENGAAILHLTQTPISRLLHGLEEEFMNLAKTKGVSLVWDVAAPDRELPISELHLRGALRNLLDNAIKFTSEGGSVTFSVKDEKDQTVMSVSDTGIGVKPDELPKLFTKFHRGTSAMVYDYAGTGIGLYAAKLVVTAHRGTISVTSQLGKGSTFTIYLPNQSPEVPKQ